MHSEEAFAILIHLGLELLFLGWSICRYGILTWYPLNINIDMNPLRNGKGRLILGVILELDYWPLHMKNKQTCIFI